MFTLLLGLTALAPLAQAASVTLNPGDDVKSLTSSLGPGDEIVFNPGTYELTERLDWSGLGTEAAPIVIRGAGTGEVILRSTVNSQAVYIGDSTFITVRDLTIEGGTGWDTGEISPGGVEIRGSANIVVQDVEMRQLNRTAVYLSGDNTQIELVGLHIHDIRDGTAIYAGCGDASCWTQDSLIAESWIHDLDGQYSYGIYLDHGAQNNVLRDNVVYNIVYRALLTASTESGPPNVVEGNAVFGVGDVGVYLAGSAQARNNVVFNVDGYGIHARNNSRDTLEDLVISHNTVANTGRVGIVLESWAGREGMVLANNAVSNPVGEALYAADGNLDEGNLLTGNIATGLVTGLDALAGHFSAGHGDADFVDAANWDFYPSSASLLVGAADPAAEAWVPSTDFNGAPRDGDAPDVGAYERVGSSNPGWAIQEGFKELGIEDNTQTDQVGGCCGSQEGEPAQAALLLPLAALARRRRR